MSQSDLKKASLDIRVVITDVDGVLTDGGMYYSEQGDEFKKFNVRDGVGVALLQAAGIKVGAMTGESNRLVIRRLKKTGIDFMFYGVTDKKRCLQSFLRDKDFQANQVAYIGDEINDLPLLGEVGLFFTVADGSPQIHLLADAVLQVNGGQGALREAAEIILKNQGKTKNALEIYRQHSKDKSKEFDYDSKGSFIEFEKQ